MSGASLPGFRDFYPADFAQRAWLFERWREVCRRFGYAETDGPPLEPLELYTKKSGAEIVGQLYAFEDRGGRQVALRPEMTPTVARMVAARANALRKPVRWFSIPQLFRYERQQKGRLREHFQLNVDLFGEDDLAADAELLAVGCEIMRACGLGPGDVRARVSDRRLLSAILRASGVPDDGMPAAFAAIDKVERDDQATLVKRMGEAGIGATVAAHVLDLAVASDFEALRDEFGEVPAVREALDRFDRYRELLRAHGVLDYLDLDLRIVRGLAYYTGIVFELFDARGEFRAICGGGRYDDLLESLGGVSMPALGFGMGDVVLSALLMARGKMPEGQPSLDVWVVAQEQADPIDAVRAATALRRFGLAAGHVMGLERLHSQKANKQEDVGRRAGAENYLSINSRRDGHVIQMGKAERTAGRREVRIDALCTATSADEYARVAPPDDGVLWLLRHKGLWHPDAPDPAR
jgi:histidyl-tRNA synthetase